MSFSGKMRIFFNVHNDAPRVWCVRGADNGWEIAVCDVQFIGVNVISKYARHTVGKHDLYEPSAWFEVEGRCVISGGSACITT